MFAQSGATDRGAPREWHVDFHLSSVFKFTHGLQINTNFLLTCNIPAIKSTTHGGFTFDSDTSQGDRIWVLRKMSDRR